MVSHKKSTAIFLHGLFVDKTIWTPLFSHLKKITPLSFDYKGTVSHSKDQIPSSSIEELAEEVAAYLEEQEIQEVVLCGHSMGGAVAQALPSYLQKVNIKATILIGSFLTLPPRAKIFSDSILKLIDSPIPFQALLPMQLGILFGEQALLDESLLHGFAQKIAAQDESFSKKVLKAQLNALLHFNAKTFSSTNKNPIHLIAGEEDTLSTTSYNQILKEQIPAQSLKTINSAGHMIPLEQPGQLAEAIEAIVD